MSNSKITDDKEVLENGRKSLSENIQVSLRDQIPQKLLKKLKEKDVGTKVRNMWSVGNAEQSVWFERQRRYLADWDEFLEVNDQGPFTGSSNLHLPVPFIVAKTFHSRMLQAIDGIDPGIKPRRADSIASAEMLQALLTYSLKEWVNHHQGISDTLDSWLWTWITTGVGIKKWRWDTKYTQYIDVVRSVHDQDDVIFEVDNIEGQVNVPQAPQIVESEELVTKKIFEGPVCDWVQPEDVIVINGEGDPQKADSVIHRQFITASDMWTFVEQKIFDEAAVEAVIQGGEDAVSGSQNSEIKQERSQNSGKGQLDTEIDLDRYEILEAYLKVDVEGTGINSDVVVWVHERTGEILRANYLHRINKGGMRPFVKIDFYKRPGEERGMGLIEVLHPLTAEMDAIHNMRIDFGLLATMPFGFYRPASSIKPEKLKLEPGSLIPLDNPQADVVFPNLGNRTAFGFQEEEALMNLVERMTGVSDVTLGVVSGSQGATRTATGTRALQQESNANLNVHLRRLMRGWKQSLEYLVHMLQQRIPPGMEFRVTGEDGKDYFAQIRNAQDIAGDFDFEVTTDSTQSNPTIQQSNALEILQMVSNPLFIQIGTVSAGNIFEAQKNFLKSKGIQDWARFVQKPAQHRLSLSPEEELNRVVRGQTVPVTPEADHEGFIAYFDFISKSDELLSQFSPEAISAVQAQAEEHQRMASALQQAQAQAANIQQQQINSQQAPGGGGVTFQPGGDTGESGG